MNKVIIREVRKSYQPIVDYLLVHKEFDIINLLDKDETPIQSKKAWLKQGLAAAWSMLLHLGFIRQAHESVVLIGNYSAVFALLLNRLHLIRPKQLYWWGILPAREKSAADHGPGNAFPVQPQCPLYRVFHI